MERKKIDKCTLTRLWCLWIFGVQFVYPSQFGFGIRLGDAPLLFDILRPENNNNNVTVVITTTTLAGLCNVPYFDFRRRSEKIVRRREIRSVGKRLTCERVNESESCRYNNNNKSVIIININVEKDVYAFFSRTGENGSFTQPNPMIIIIFIAVFVDELKKNRTGLSNNKNNARYNYYRRGLFTIRKQTKKRKTTITPRS